MQGSWRAPGPERLGPGHGTKRTAGRAEDKRGPYALRGHAHNPHDRLLRGRLLVPRALCEHATAGSQPQASVLFQPTQHHASATAAVHLVGAVEEEAKGTHTRRTSDVIPRFAALRQENTNRSHARQEKGRRSAGIPIGCEAKSTHVTDAPWSSVHPLSRTCPLPRLVMSCATVSPASERLPEMRPLFSTGLLSRPCRAITQGQESGDPMLEGLLRGVLEGEAGRQLQAAAAS